MSPPWVHHVRRTFGIGFCQYEGTALLVDDDTVVPKWTHLCHPAEDGSTAENRVRLVLAVGSAVWVGVHMLRPWVRRWLRNR